MNKIEALQKLASEHIAAAQKYGEGSMATHHLQEASQIAQMIANLSETPEPHWTMPPTIPGMPPFTCRDTIS